MSRNYYVVCCGERCLGLWCGFSADEIRGHVARVFGLSESELQVSEVQS